MIRFGWVAVSAVALGAAAAASDEPVPADKVRTVEPQVVVLVEHVPETGDLVQVLFKGALYDGPTLKADVDALGKALNAPIENYQEFPAEGADQPTKVFFVTHNIIDPAMGDYRLQPVVRSLMRGAGGQSVESFSVQMLGQRPNAYTTLAKYTSKFVALKAFYDAATPSIEYRILVVTKNPELVEIPPRHIPDESVPDMADRGGDRTALLMVLLLTAGASAGALVYFALLGRRA
jgi:hypothetical protein